MIGGADHPRDSLQDLLDGRLEAARRIEIEAHLATCETCRAEERALRAAKQALRSALSPSTAPAGLEDDLVRVLDREDEVRARAELPSVEHRSARRAVLATAAIVVVGITAVWLTRVARDPADVATAIAADFESVAADRLSLPLAVTEPLELERRFAAGGIAFPTHVYDLGMMGFVLAGGRVHAVAGRPSAMFAYRDPRGAWLICQMYRGSPEELPDGAEIRTRNGIQFYTFRRGKVTVVVWAEGSILCSLASDLPSDQVVELAFAKAMNPTVPQPG